MNRHSYIVLVVVISLLLASNVSNANTNKSLSDISEVVLSAFTSISTPKATTSNNQTSSDEWVVEQLDKYSNTLVNGCHVYRILIKHPVRHPSLTSQIATETMQNGPLVIQGYVYIDLVLVPSSEIKKGIDKNKIPWLELSQYYHSQPFDIGRAYGYHWFVNCPVIFQQMIREKVKLSGGEDRLQILVDALSIEDKGSFTSNSADAALLHEGRKVLPYIKKSIEKNLADNPWKQISVLGHIPGDDATALLQSLYKSTNKNVSDAASYALISKPYRKSAKPQYMDMLQRGKYTSSVCEACIQFGWKDASSILKQITQDPPNWYTYRTVFETLRMLDDKPVSQSLKDAEYTIQNICSVKESNQPSQTEILKAKQTILDSPDQEYASIIAVSLSEYNAKAYVKPVREIGNELIENLPKEATQPLINILEQINNRNKAANNK